MKKILFLVLLLPYSLIAQEFKHRIIHLPTTRETVLNNNISSIEIVNNIPDTSFIGIIPSTIRNTRTTLVLEDDMQNNLLTFVQQQFAPGFIKNGKRVLWVINALSVGTDSSTSGIISYTRLNVDIYSASSEKSGYHYFSTFDTLMIVPDTIFNFGNNINKALLALYNQSISNDTLYRAKRKVSRFSTIQSVDTSAETVPGIKHQHQQYLDCKILKDSSYSSGIYNSYQEFLDNNPSIKNFFVTVDKITHSVIMYQLNLKDSSKQMLPNAWGLCVRGELYRYLNNQLYPIERSDNGFALSKYIDFNTRKNQAIFWRQVIGKKQKDNNPYDDAHIYRTPIDSTSDIKIETTHLDLNSGDLTF